MKLNTILMSETKIILKQSQNGFEMLINVP